MEVNHLQLRSLLFPHNRALEVIDSQTLTNRQPTGNRREVLLSTANVPCSRATKFISIGLVRIKLRKSRSFRVFEARFHIK